MAGKSDNGNKVFDWPLTGKLTTSTDPVLLKKGDFQTLTNFRYTDYGLIGVSGMTKINSNVPGTNMTRVLKGFYFHKDSPTEENHILAQVRSSNGAISTTTVYKSNNTSLAIPGTTEFASFATVNNTRTVRFSPAPDSSFVFTDREKNWIWGGNEARTAAFVTADPDNLYELDYTDVINRYADSNNAITLPQYSLANNTVLLYHFDGTNGSTTIPDAIGNHSIPGNGSTTAVLYTGFGKKFGNASCDFNGSAKILVNDSADFDCSGGNWSIDFWFYKPNVNAQTEILWSHASDANNCAYIVYAGTGHPAHLASLTYKVFADGAEKVSVTIGSFSLGAETNPYHYYIGQSGSTYYSAINGYLGAFTNANNAANYSGNFTIGCFNNNTGAYAYYYDGGIDEFRVSNYARWTTSFTPPSTAASVSNMTYLYLGAIRPVDGFKIYVATPNNATDTSPPAVSYVSNGTWVNVDAANITDGTANGNISLNNTGTISFPTTENNATLAYKYGRYLYWYCLTFTELYANTTIYKITTSMPVQGITDIWDGVERRVPYMFRERSSNSGDVEDLSVRIQDNYIDLADNSTFYDLHGLLTTNAMIFGANERLSGLKMSLQSGANTVNAMHVQYWNGNNWTQVQGMTDGTMSGGKSLATSGAVTWSTDQGLVINERRKTISVGVGKQNVPLTYAQWLAVNPHGLVGRLSGHAQQEYAAYLSSFDYGPIQAPIYGPSTAYYYRMYWDNTLSGTNNHIYLFYVAGIAAPKKLLPYEVPVMWNKSLCLLNEYQGDKNKMIVSAPETSCVFSGSASGEVYIGDADEIVGAETLYTRDLGMSAESLVALKRKSTYLITGAPGAGYASYTVSNTIGLAAPHSLVRCESGIENLKSRKCVLIWQASHGVVAFDGATLETISDDISNFFDPNNDDYMADPSNSTAFYDPHRGEYHLLFTAANGSRPDTEFVYDLGAKKWFQIDRDDKDLRCGFSLMATNGTHYCYGGGNAGYIYRLENNNSFDGNNITHTFRFGDISLAGSMMYESELRKVKLTGVKKSNETSTVSVKIYTDGKSTASNLTSISQNNSGRYYDVVRSCTIKGVTYSMEFSLINNNETFGFEPLVVSGVYRPIREDW